MKNYHINVEHVLTNIHEKETKCKTCDKIFGEKIPNCKPGEVDFSRKKKHKCKTCDKKSFMNAY